MWPVASSATAHLHALFTYGFLRLCLVACGGASTSIIHVLRCRKTRHTPIYICTATQLISGKMQTQFKHRLGQILCKVYFNKLSCLHLLIEYDLNSSLHGLFILRTLRFDIFLSRFCSGVLNWRCLRCNCVVFCVRTTCTQKRGHVLCRHGFTLAIMMWPSPSQLNPCIWLYTD